MLAAGTAAGYVCVRSAGADETPHWLPAAASTEPLSPDEEADGRALALARRFNPAMALPSADGPYPVAVGYVWRDGADLRARSLDARGEVVRDVVAARADSLDRVAWNRLPLRDDGGRRVEYWIDAPGDDELVDGVSRWRRRFREIAARSALPPTQYAHLFWLSRERGLLAIQYWFFFPFNEWVNHHEGDWEHINVVLRGGPRLDAPASFVPIAYEFYFHGQRIDLQPGATLASPETDGDRHAVVFVGGRGRFLLWSGTQSGGSYPWPTVFPGAGAGPGFLGPSDDTRAPVRLLPASAFEVVLLPEPERLDARAHPELSWLALPFFAGQPRVATNPPLLERLAASGPPPQPARRREWNAIRTSKLWSGSTNPAPAVAARELAQLR